MWLSESPLMMDIVDYNGIGGSSNIHDSCYLMHNIIHDGYMVPNINDMNPEGLSNVFSSPRNTPFLSLKKQKTKNAKDGIMSSQQQQLYQMKNCFYANKSNDNDCSMLIHYNNSYQPLQQDNFINNTSIYMNDRFFNPEIRNNGPCSPQRVVGQDSLSVLAESCIASAEKEKQQLSQKLQTTIFASSSDHGVSGLGGLHNNASSSSVNELSQIIKSDESPDTLYERCLHDSTNLVDVSFSTLADLSLMKNNGMQDSSSNIVLSPIAAKSPDISMTPYLNCLTLDSNSQGSGDLCNENNDSVHHSENDISLPHLNRTLFTHTTISTKRKHQSILGDSNHGIECHQQQQQQQQEGSGDLCTHESDVTIEVNMTHNDLGLISIRLLRLFIILYVQHLIIIKICFLLVVLLMVEITH